MSTASELGAGVLGPALAGVTFAVAPSLPLGLDAASFALSAVLIGSFALRHPRLRPERAAAVRSGLAEAAAGLALLRRSPLLRSTTLLLAATALFGWMPEATFVLFATRQLGASSAEFGLLMAVTPIGAVIGGLAAGRLVRPGALVPVTVLTMASYGVITLAVGFLHAVVPAVALMAVQGLPLIVCSATISSLQQLSVPDRLRGRFRAVTSGIYAIVTPTGLALGGTLAWTVGLAAPQIVGGLGCLAALAATAPGLWTAARRRGIAGSAAESI